MKMKFGIKEVVATGIGTALFVALTEVQIPLGFIPNTALQPRAALLAFLAAVFGPVVGGIVGLLGHAIGDALFYGSVWWSWVFPDAVFGIIVGLFAAKYKVKEGSFGFLPYDKVRDKDAPASICLICEIAAWAKDQGKTLYDLLMQIYAEYGFSKEFTVNVVRPGKTGADEIKQMMADFRANPPKELGGSKIVTWKDYQSLEAKHADGSVEKLDMPTTSNVLQWFCDDNTKVSVRPSGTEPKIKFYIEVKDPSFKCAGCYNRCTAAAMDKIEAIKKSLNQD